MLRVALFVLAILAAGTPVLLHAGEVEVTLRGSRASMLRQNGIARTEAFSFLRTPAQVRKYYEEGNLVELPGNDDYHVIAGYPFARPVVRSLIERLASDYAAACGERLVVTSLTRPSTRQPANASPLSVHPAGMAVDLRVSARQECRGWLTAELLRLEEAGVLDATLERRPPHFHVAVFPRPWEQYEQRIVADSVVAESVRLLEEAVAAREAGLFPADADGAGYEDGAAKSLALVRIARWVARLVLPGVV
jgi:hypothetical protein